MVGVLRYENIQVLLHINVQVSLFTGAPPRALLLGVFHDSKIFYPIFLTYPQKLSSPWSFQLEVMDPWLLLAPSSSSVQPYLQSSPSHPEVPHSLPQQTDWVSYCTDIRESLGAGYALPSSASGPVFSLLCQDFVVFLSSLTGPHPLY